MSDGGKGSAPRPFSVDQKTYENNWEAIFGKKDKKDEVGIGEGKGDYVNQPIDNSLTK